MPSLSSMMSSSKTPRDRKFYTVPDFESAPEALRTKGGRDRERSVKLAKAIHDGMVDRSLAGSTQ